MRRRKANLAQSSIIEIERHLTRNLADLNPLRIDQINRLLFSATIKKYAAKGSKVQANRTAVSASLHQ